MTNHARNGGARERRVRDHLIGHDWELISKSGGSKGPADLVMAHPSHGVALIQVGTANKRLGPTDRTRLLRAAWLCSAVPVLATPIPGIGIRYLKVTADTPRHWTEWNPA